MSKHTPGPWEFNGPFSTTGGRNGYFVQSPDIDVCVIPFGVLDTEAELSAKRDARLIAAAPELLEALQECITDDNAMCIVQNDVAYMIRRLRSISNVARAAIAKATGEQP